MNWDGSQARTPATRMLATESMSRSGGALMAGYNARRAPTMQRDMSDVAYVSKVRVERIKGPLRRAYLPAEDAPVTFSTHGEVSQHYGSGPRMSSNGRRPLIMWSLPRRVDSPGRWEARWRRVGSMQAEGS